LKMEGCISQIDVIPRLFNELSSRAWRGIPCFIRGLRVDPESSSGRNDKGYL